MQRRPRGTQDVLPPASTSWQYVEALARRLAERFGFQEIRTPVFEHTELFARGVGEGTDVVEKEMYTFLDRSGRSLSLRPESTAAVVRALAEAGRLPQREKVYYLQSHFRYERPQAGRLRQHHQFGVEFFGEPSPYADAEVIVLAVTILRALGLSAFEVRLNSLGDAQCRPAYREALVAFLRSREEAFCDDCRRRLATNPLRVLDCKVPGCVAARQGHPEARDYLCEACREHLRGVLSLLEAQGVPVCLDAEVVRGLDYYTRTVFEIVGTEGTYALVGGGRYDHLAEALGAPPTPAVGFGLGVERLLEALGRQGLLPPPRPPAFVLVAIAAEEVAEVAFRLAMAFREAGVATDYAFPGRSLKSQMRLAHRLGVPYVAIVGKEEAASGTVTLRRLADGEEQRVDRTWAVEILRREVEAR